LKITENGITEETVYSNTNERDDKIMTMEEDK
jgi:hypothetical protein